MNEMHCPNCGDLVSPAIKRVKMITCASCTTTLLLEDAGLRLAGEQGVLHDVPMLFGLGDTLRIAKPSYEVPGATMGPSTTRYEVLGHARFSYGRGTWDEFWAIDGQGAPVWISVDEGDLILQRLLARADWPKYDGYLRLGSSLKYNIEAFRVEEIGTGTCIGLKGSFGHQLTVGESYQFLNLQGDEARVLSAEIQGAQREWFIGHWVDPFDVEVQSI
jgi:Domain of unknown function (DUF4178)